MFIHLIRRHNQVKHNMKKVFLFAIIATALVACNNAATTEAGDAQEVAEATGAEKYAVNAAESIVNWKGANVTGKSHIGTIALKSGSINTDNDAITAGNFEIDMTALTSGDGMDEENTGKLLGHLSSPDFFDVANNPTAKFEISTATADSLTGNLTIKGITKSITIPYTWTEAEGAATATSTFSINRALWEVKYGSSSFFEGLGDKVINDVIEFDVTLKATK